MSGTRQRRVMRHTSKQEKRSYLSPPTDEPWIWLPHSLMESQAWAALSRAGHRVLTRLFIEHMHHAGRENGRLAVSYAAFEAFGVERKAIAKALWELDALGLVRRSDPGRRSFGSDPGKVACYRLTFAGVVGSDEAGPPTDEWRSVTAESAARVAMELKGKRRGARAKPVVEAKPAPLRRAS